MVTHDAVAASFADRLLVLGDGRIVHDGEAATADDVLDLMKAVGWHAARSPCAGSSPASCASR